MQTPFSTLRGLIRALPALGFALVLAAPASAQVDYVREVVLPGGLATVLPAPQGPYETDYFTSASPKPYFVTTTNYYSLNSSTGAFGPAAQFPANAILDADSITVFVGQNTGPQLFIISARQFLVTFDILNGSIVSAHIEADVFSSLAARNRDGNLLSLIADNQHFTVDRFTGELIARPLAGVDMGAAFYQSYGQDGLLHVLDYNNSRMVSFDPDNAFASVGSFDLMPGVTTTNSQFGIGINGSFYLADGLGGGSYYDAAGAFQGTFGLPEDAVASPYTGANYVSTDSAGHVYVFDSATGIHQYQDASVVPEPATSGLVIGAGALLVAACRRRRASR